MYFFNSYSATVNTDGLANGNNSYDDDKTQLDGSN